MKHLLLIATLVASPAFAHSDKEATCAEVARGATNTMLARQSGASTKIEMLALATDDVQVAMVETAWEYPYEIDRLEMIVVIDEFQNVWRKVCLEKQ